MVPLARRYLFSDRLRLAISAGGVAVAVLLIVLVLGLYRGIYDQAGRLATRAPSNLWVTQAGSPDPSHGASVLPDSALGAIEEVDGVAAVQPLLARSMMIGTESNDGVASVLVLSLPDGPLQLETAEAFGVSDLPSSSEIALSGIVADDLGVARGDTVFLGTTPLRVSEVSPIVESAFGGAVFVNTDDAQRLFALSASFSFALVALSPGADVPRAEKAIESAVPGANALTSEAFANTTRREVEEGFLPVVAVLIAVAFVVGLSVISLTIYTSTVERIRDYGVLKAVGATSGQLLSVVARQSLAVALIGFAAGVALAVGAGQLLGEAVPEFVTLYRWQDVIAVLAAALLMSALAAAVPVRRVAGVDPAIVFRA